MQSVSSITTGQTTKATTTGYLTNYYPEAPTQTEESKRDYSRSEVTIKKRSVNQPKAPAPLPDEFRIYEDKAIHGWLTKQKKGSYFSEKWQRRYVIVENQKLSYYSDKSMTTHKGVVDFSKIKAKLNVLSEDTF